MKMIKKNLYTTYRWLILSCLISLLAGKGLHAQNYDFRDFQDVLPQPFVYSINQGTDGALWVGTGGGLTQYNGFKFGKLYTTDGRDNNFITCSFRDDGQLWFGHFDGTLSKLEGDSLKTVYTSSAPSPITHIESTLDGAIWASTFNNGFIHIDKTTNTITEKKLTEALFIQNFKFISDSQLLIGTPDGLWLYSTTPQGEIAPIEKLSTVPETQISSIIDLRENRKYLVATHSQGMYIVNTSGEKVAIAPIKTIAEEDFENIQDVIEDSNRNIWVATFGKGIIKLTKEEKEVRFTTEYFNASTGFNTNNVKTLFEDREGSIWSGNYGAGLTQIISQPYSLTTYKEEASDENIYSVYLDGKIKWLGTKDKLIKSHKNKTVDVFSQSAGLPIDKITAIHKTDNFLWIGTESSGIYNFNCVTNKALKYSLSDGQLENSITALTGEKEILWVATKKGICKINTQSNSQKWFTIEKGTLPHNLINDIYLDSKSRLWLSTPNNIISFIADDQVKKFPIHSNNKLFTIGSITEDSTSTIWIGTQGAGVFRVKKDSIANLTTSEGLFSNYCYSIAADQKGNIWVTHKGGISKINANDFSIAPIHEYAGIDKNCQFHKNAIATGPEGQVWMGSNQGLWTYTPKYELRSESFPILSILSIKIDGESVELDKNIKLKSGTYTVAIDYMGIQLKTPKNVWYSYQLHGFDHEPTHTQQTSVTYKQLKHGEYTFSLSASSDEEASISKPITFSITITTPFWKLWWFYITISLGAVAMATIVLAQREHKHKFEKSILESEVRNRGDELTQKSVLLDEKQELIIQQNKELKVYQNYLEQLVDERTEELMVAKNRAEESDRLKTAFLNNISHEIRTPLHAVCGFSKFLDDEAFNDAEKSQFIKTINQNAEELLHMVNGIMDISLIEANQNVIVDEPFNIEALLIELEDLFRGKNNKPIHIQFVPPATPSPNFTLKYDRLRIRHIFTHLLDNSLKFTETGKILFGYEKFEKEVRFYVSDTGIGIDASELKKIFQPFHKGTSVSQKLYRGSGIGLSICKKIVDIMHGDIWIDSEVEKGTVIYFTIPIDPINS